jgi:hypothetical protein
MKQITIASIKKNIKKAMPRAYKAIKDDAQKHITKPNRK